MIPGSAAADGRLARLYQANAQDAARIAHLLCSDDTDPGRKANKAFVKTVAAFRDLRNPLTFEASLRRAVIKECKPRLWRRARSLLAGSGGSPAGDDAPDDLWAAFERQSHRRKAALVLRYLEAMTDDQVADVLGSSTGTARTLVNRALSDIQPSAADKANPARVAAELQRAFRTRGDGVQLPVEPDRRLLRRASAGRRAAALGVVALSVAGAVTATIGVRAAVRASDAATAPSPVQSSSPPEMLSLYDADLVPEADLTPERDERVAASGLVDGVSWRLLVEAASNEQICLILEVGTEFEKSHCEARAFNIFHGFVDGDEAHDATFITGYALDEVARMTLAVDDEDETIPVELVGPPESLPRRLERRFFVVVLPGYVDVFESENEAIASGDRIIRTLLQARSKDGTPIEHQPIYLGLP